MNDTTASGRCARQCRSSKATCAACDRRTVVAVLATDAGELAPHVELVEQMQEIRLADLPWTALAVRDVVQRVRGAPVAAAGVAIDDFDLLEWFHGAHCTASGCSDGLT